MFILCQDNYFTKKAHTLKWRNHSKGGLILEKRKDYERFGTEGWQNGEAAENNINNSPLIPFDNIEDALKWIEEGEPDLD